MLAVLAGNPVGEHKLVMSVIPLPAIGVSVGLQGAELTPRAEVQLSNVVVVGRY
jgi:hypothetical protein